MRTKRALAARTLIAAFVVVLLGAVFFIACGEGKTPTAPEHRAVESAASAGSAPADTAAEGEPPESVIEASLATACASPKFSWCHVPKGKPPLQICIDSAGFARHQAHVPDFALLTLYRDDDGDGYGTGATQTGCVAPPGFVQAGGDCDDANAATHPGASDSSCNGVDDDCDGTADDDLGNSDTDSVFDACDNCDLVDNEDQAICTNEQSPADGTGDACDTDDDNDGCSDDIDTADCDPSVCIPGKVIGAACGEDVECQSGVCADGVCCSDSCEGVCESCDQAGILGTCTPFSHNTDPDDECSATSPSSCGTTGACSGGSTCALHSIKAICGPESCVDETTVNRIDRCDGNGNCVDGGTTSCEPYICAPNSCPRACSADLNCASGYHCDLTINRCIPD
jgi:hypothetical protein